MFIIQEQVRNPAQDWMNKLREVIQTELGCDASARQDSAWNTASIDTSFDSYKELQFQIQFNSATDTELSLGFILEYFGPLGGDHDKSQTFHYSFRINMNETSPKQYGEYIMSLYNRHKRMMVNHQNGILSDS